MTRPATTLTVDERTVHVPLGRVTLDGDLTIPAHARAVVLFAHGSGSSRFSSRNRRVAGLLQERGFATLLMDLLTPSEEAVDGHTGQYRLDIERRAERRI